MRPLACATGFVLAMLALSPPAPAQERFPARPVQVIVPATPGGPVDTAVRLIEPALASALGSSVVLINKPGASGTLGMQAVASAAPDGYTIGQGVNSIFTITRISGTHVPFTLDDFSLLGNYVTDVSVLAVSADAKWKTFDDVVAYARANPGKLNYASAGIGTVSQLSMETLAHKFSLNMVAVPFPGGAQLTTAILGKQIDIGMVPYTTGAAMFKANKLRPLLTTAPERLRQLPGIPTFADKGITENGLNLIMGLYAPRALSDGLRDTLTDAVAKAARDPAFVAKVEGLGLLARYEGPAAARKRLEVEYADIVALNHALQR
ncbi:MAG TPA: tripartite tricarboxylate transporter substrate binding protein [Xanthobacteraceae bacterium]|nr:tripartite tricarboxylate transporter substrate binding protein [Xanthobacteraceae bacterium]